MGLLELVRAAQDTRQTALISCFDSRQTLNSLKMSPYMFIYVAATSDKRARYLFLGSSSPGIGQAVDQWIDLQPEVKTEEE